MAVHIFDENWVKYEFFDMYTNSGPIAGTAEVNFSKMNRALSQYNMSWVNCVCLSVDNTSVNPDVLLLFLGSANPHLLYSLGEKESCL